MVSDNIDREWQSYPLDASKTEHLWLADARVRWSAGPSKHHHHFCGVMYDSPDGVYIYPFQPPNMVGSQRRQAYDSNTTLKLANEGLVETIRVAQVLRCPSIGGRWQCLGRCGHLSVSLFKSGISQGGRPAKCFNVQMLISRQTPRQCVELLNKFLISLFVEGWLLTWL